MTRKGFLKKVSKNGQKKEEEEKENRGKNDLIFQSLPFGYILGIQHSSNI